MEFVIMVIVYGLLIALIGYISNKKDRNPYFWAILALFITPIISLLIVSILPKGSHDSGESLREISRKTRTQ